ncbi:MAG: CoA transferase [Dehalococcoidales bacterium]|nr:CoA transferase [Dehalococcoidales bacterium]
MYDHLLDGYRAIDLTDEKGFICGQILAMMGVDVIKIEDPVEKKSADVHFSDRHKIDQSYLHWKAFNTDKKCITLNIQQEAGQELFKNLTKKVDFIIESFQPGYLKELGIGYDSLKVINPKIIFTSISHFGQRGPYSRYKGSELVDSAMSGVLYDTGYPDRPPVKEALFSCYYHANVAAILGTLLSHYQRERSGRGQQVDVSIQEVATSRNVSSLLAWIFDKKIIGRSWGQLTGEGLSAMRRVWPCKDGYVFWLFAVGSVGAAANKALSKWMDEERSENPLNGISNWDAFNITSLSDETRKEYENAIGSFFKKHTKEELAQEGLQRGINCAVVNNVADILYNQHLKARDFWTDINYPDLGTLTYPKFLFLSNRTQNYIQQRAPRLGEHNTLIYKNLLSLSSLQIAALEKDGVI